MTILNDPNLERLLDRLHELSDAQTPAIREYRAERDKVLDRAPEEQAALTKAFLADKIYALDRDKAEFCYQICRTIDARRVVEIGTSYGVSTLYLAAAVRDNIRAGGGSGVVIGTEYEPEKASAARSEFRRSRVEQLHRSSRGRSAGDASWDRRTGRFHAGRHLDTDGTTGTRTRRSAPATKSGRDLR